MKIQMYLKPNNNALVTQVELRAKAYRLFTPLQRMMLNELGTCVFERKCDMGGDYEEWAVIITCDHSPKEPPAYQISPARFVKELVARIRELGFDVEIA